jgi:hypothetical protein
MKPAIGKSDDVHFSLTRIAASIAVILTTCGSGYAREVVSLTDEFGILRDFSHVTISGPEIKNARVFFDASRFVLDGRSSPADNSELQKTAINELSSRVQLVKSKDEANYLMQIRMGLDFDYAIQNPQREPSHGYVMISICKFPIRNMSEDCENLQYNYFQDYKATTYFPLCFECGSNRQFFPSDAIK